MAQSPNTNWLEIDYRRFTQVALAMLWFQLTLSINLDQQRIEFKGILIGLITIKQQQHLRQQAPVPSSHDGKKLLQYGLNQTEEITIAIVTIEVSRTSLCLRWVESTDGNQNRSTMCDWNQNNQIRVFHYRVSSSTPYGLYVEPDEIVKKKRDRWITSKYEDDILHVYNQTRSTMDVSPIIVVSPAVAKSKPLLENAT